MKTSFKSALLGMATLGIFMTSGLPTHAKDFVVDQAKYEKHQQEVMQRSAYEAAQAKKGGYRKGQYSGSSAYNGRIAGQLARREARNGNRIVVHPVRGANQEFNASLRYGDTSQSAETRLNHSFNN